MRVLVVDDDPGIRALIGTTLTLEGVAVYMASDGQEALDLVQAKSQPFDAIVLDLGMPVMDGRAFYHALHELTPEQLAPPVLVLSAYGAKEAQRELGAQSSMDKPFDPAVLFERVQELVTAS